MVVSFWGSRPVVGSSKNNIGGSQTKAAARANLYCGTFFCHSYYSGDLKAVKISRGMENWLATFSSDGHSSLSA